ncbi:hypothetical protein [Neobacillus mesonae]|uniref:hypothetical protein n=1 Tax=Neobacillus mesonae TaxID=1193713 RepID=UPI002042523F|nr:hypothetical protein [Neobacillus mesonae]MCM3570643.1 hypothetical protein [Neobacillus mesonae]
MDFLVGVKEASEILGWDRRKVSTYHSRGVLPKPIVNLSSGPIWFRKQIERYKAGKEGGITAYYISGETVYECKQNHPIKETCYSPDEILESSGDYSVFLEKEIEQLKNIILEKKPIIQFLSLESINYLHELGILETEVYGQYAQHYSCTIGNSREGRNEQP